MFNRRTWLKLLPALAALPSLEGQVPVPSPVVPRVTKEMVVKALGAIGLEFTDAHIVMMLPTVNREFAQFEALRKIDIPLDTPPAVTFSPLFAGFKRPVGRSQFRRGKAPALLRFSQPEELAFCRRCSWEH